MKKHTRAQAKEFLEEVEEVAASRHAVRPAIVRENAPYRGIIHTAEKRGCDLIFMGPHGAHGLESMFAGSQTQKVLQNSKISVMIYR